MSDAEDGEGNAPSPKPQMRAFARIDGVNEVDMKGTRFIGDAEYGIDASNIGSFRSTDLLAISEAAFAALQDRLATLAGLGVPPEEIQRLQEALVTETGSPAAGGGSGAVRQWFSSLESQVAAGVITSLSATGLEEIAHCLAQYLH